MAKIVLLATQNLESPSGLGRHFPFALELSRRGHEVILLALHPDIENLEQREFCRQGVQVRYIAPMHVRKSGGEKSYYPIWKLMWIVIQSTSKFLFTTIQIKPDLIMVLKAQPMNSLGGWLAARFLGIPVILDGDDVESTSNNARNWQRSILAYYEERFARHFDQITTNTQYLRQKFIRLGFQPEKITFIPNGVSPERFIVEPEYVATLREQMKLGDQPVIGYIGSLALSSHPIDLLLKAFQVVAVGLPNARLLIVGGGESRDKLQTLADELGIANRTLFVGRISPDQVGAYYRMCNVLVDPVIDDETAAGRCPLKLFESWYCGIPFVTSAVGDRGELLGNPPAGLLANPGDATDLAMALKRILLDPNLASDLSNRGLEQVKKYTWDVLGEKLIKVINRLI